MGKLKDKRWPYIVLSILLATALWLYVRTQGDTDASKPLDRIPVVFNGVEALQSRGLMVASGEGQTVDLQVKGQWTTMNRITRDSVSVVVDLSRITEAGEYSLAYDINFADPVSATGVSIQERTPRQITVVIADYAEKDVEVQANFGGSVAEGFQTGKVVVSPETIHISGDAERVEQVAYAKVTVTGNGLTQTVTGDYPVELMDENDNVIDHSGLTMSAETIFVTLPVVTTKDIPLTVNLLPGGGATTDDVTCTITPSVISVSGEQEHVEGLEEISLGTIDLGKVTSTGIFTFNIVLPSTLTNVSEVTTATVTITINGLSTKVVTVTNIEVINAPEGFSASAVTQTKDVLVRGSQEAIDKIDASHIRLTADLSDAPSATGRYTVDAVATLEGVENAGAVGEYSIVVSLTRS